MRRILHALAALAVAGMVLVIAGNPAAAAPGGLCTADEWRNPVNFASCAERTRTELSRKATCLTAPTPAGPGSGVGGLFATRPDSNLRNGVPGRYSDYGVAGYPLEMYDDGCLGAVLHPQDKMFNSAASFTFKAATWIIAASNGLRVLAYQPGGIWSWSDGLVKSATEGVYTYVFTPFGGLTVAITGLYLIYRSRQGNLSDALRMGGWALFVMVVVTALFKYPVVATHGADRAAATGLSVMHGVLGPAPQSLPADQCNNPDPDACIDHRTAAVRAADTVTEAILYRNWLRATLGSSDSPTAQKYGFALYDASALTWAEEANIRDHPELRQTITNTKGQQWMTIAEAIKTEDPAAYENLRGMHAEDRFGDAIVAVLAAMFYAAFDMAASLMILIGFAIFRLAVVAIPLLGTIGILEMWSASFRRVCNLVIVAAWNIVVFGAAGGFFLKIVGYVFTSSLVGWIQVLLVALFAVAGWLGLRPVRRVAEVASWMRSDKKFIPHAQAAAGQTRTELEQVGAKIQPHLDRAAMVATVAKGIVRPETTATTVARVIHGTFKAAATKATPTPPAPPAPASARPGAPVGSSKP